MDKEAFRHVIQAAASIVDDELIVVGSQALLGSLDDPPASMVRSQEVDLFPRTRQERAIEIDGALGDGSPFHEMNGYYAHAVGPETITAPAGWEERLVRFEAPQIPRASGNAIGLCLSLPDLMLAKLAAGRERDFAFVGDAMRHEIVTFNELELGIGLMPEAIQALVRERLTYAAALSTRSG